MRLLHPGLIASGLLIAAIGSLQYLPNLLALWSNIEAPSAWSDRLGTFWFDVTKADWRQTLVMSVSEAGLQNRPAMYWFDLHQQFGTPGALLAIAGFVFVAIRRPRAGTLLLLLYLVNLVFAWTYNVGDVHVFFLPSNYIVALCAGAGVMVAKKGSGAFFWGNSAKKAPDPFFAVAAAACLLYAAWHGYDTLPAVDRSWDHRPEQVLSRFTTPPDVPTGYSRKAIFGVDANWQVQNAFEYFMKRERPGVPWFTSEDLEWLDPPGVTERFRHFALVNASCAPMATDRHSQKSVVASCAEVLRVISHPVDSTTLACSKCELKRLSQLSQEVRLRCDFRPPIHSSSGRARSRTDALPKIAPV